MKSYTISGLLLLMLLVSDLAYSQVKFEYVYGGTNYDYGYSVTQTYDKGYVVVGATTSFGSGATDAYLLKVDSMGIAKLQRTYGGINIDQAYSVNETTDTGLVIAGYTNSFGHGGYDMYIVKTNKYADTVWTKTIGGSDWDFAYSAQQTSDGGYIVAGGTYSYGNGSEDMYLVKLNSLGDTVWTKTYGGANDDEAKSVKQTSDGGYILTGYSKSFGDPNGDIYTIKTDSMGDTLWTYKYQGLLDDYSYDVLEDNTGSGYIICGETKSAALGFQGAIIRLTMGGSQISVSTIYGGAADDGINSITQTADGRFATMGYTNSFGAGASDFAFYVEKPIGTFVGSLTYGGAKDDIGYCIKNAKDGGFIICGNSLSYSTLDHIYLIKTDSLGIATGTVINVVTGMNNVSKTENNFNLFPNPANNNVTVVIPKSLKNGTLIITDVLGREFFHQQFEGNLEKIEVPTISIPNGIYFISLENNTSKLTDRLIIEH